MAWLNKRLVLGGPPSTSFHSHQPLVVTQRNKPVVCHRRASKYGKKCVAEASRDDSWPSASSSPHHVHLYQHLSKPKNPGALHGEGFVHFKIGSSDPVRMDVDRLNESLKHTGAARLKNVMNPDAAFGLIFNFDSMVANTRAAHISAWQELAQSKGLPVHDASRLVLHNTCPERIIMDVLGWTRDMKEARQLSFELADLYGEAIMKQSEPAPGLRVWLDALANYSVPCALVSALARPMVRRVLERMHLHDHFQIMITAEDDMETISQRYLSAAMALQRPPNHCVVFDDCPEAMTAAHNCSMKAVAVCTNHPAYKLKTADLTCSSLSQLTVYNMRRLFANSGEEFMDLKHQHSSDKPVNRRRITSATI